MADSEPIARLPPESTSGLSAVMEWTDWLPESIVTVGLAPETLMVTSSPGPGTWPVLQLAGLFQSPLEVVIQLTVDRSCAAPGSRDRVDSGGARPATAGWRGTRLSLGWFTDEALALGRLRRRPGGREPEGSGSSPDRPPNSIAHSRDRGRSALGFPKGFTR